MRKKYLILIPFFSLLTVFVHSQDANVITIGFEGGTGFVTGKLNDKWNVRQDIASGYSNYGYGSNYGYSDYSSNSGSNSISSEMDMYYFGIKPGIYFPNYNINISAGLRFSRINSYLNKNSSSNDSYFFLKYNESGTNTEYFKVKGINENVDYLGIPLEITLTPFHFDVVNLYAKVGAEVNLKLNSQTDIDFLNNNMKTYQQGILDKVGVKVNSIYSSVYAALGIRFGRATGIKYNFEVTLPARILSSNNSSLVVPEYYSGIQFSVQIPINKAKESKNKE